MAMFKFKKSNEQLVQEQEIADIAARNYYGYQDYYDYEDREYDSEVDSVTIAQMILVFAVIIFGLILVMPI